MNQEKAQRKWDKSRAEESRRLEKCNRCAFARWAHNRGNRWYDNDICRKFLEPAEATHEGGSE